MAILGVMTALHQLTGEKLIMEKVLKYERQLTCTTWGVFCLVMAFGVLGFYFDSGNFLRAGTYLASGFTIAHGMSRRVIKELKSENESLKSGGSADTTPPEEE
jgi:hypothetical protein